MLESAARPAPSILPAGPEWIIATAPVPYEAAMREMAMRAEAIADGRAPECVWLLEHLPVYTAGTSADPSELLDPGRFPVIRTGRGGRFTYHGPGQRVAYVMLDLSSRGRDVRAFVTCLEDWLIAALARLGIEGERRQGAVGVFAGGAKIASIGLRVRRWVTLHGVSLNVDPNLEHFSGIVPCGLQGSPIASLAALGARPGMARVDLALREAFDEVFDGKD